MLIRILILICFALSIVISTISLIVLVSALDVGITMLVYPSLLGVLGGAMTSCAALGFLLSKDDSHESPFS